MKSGVSCGVWRCWVGTQGCSVSLSHSMHKHALLSSIDIQQTYEQCCCHAMHVLRCCRYSMGAAVQQPGVCGTSAVTLGLISCYFALFGVISALLSHVKKPAGACDHQEACESFKSGSGALNGRDNQNSCDPIFLVSNPPSPLSFFNNL